MKQMAPTFADIVAAREVVSRVIHRTPVIPSRALSHLAGAQVFLKAENLQRTGAFKIRGALYKLSLMTPEQRIQGVIAASAGNHAQGIALAAQTTGVPCTVVMPKDVSLPKLQATRNYGARVVLKGEGYDEAQREARRLVKTQGLIPIHAFDDEDIIAGQGSIGLELLDELDGFDVVVVPVGGGGLIAGVALAIKEQRPGVRIIGVQARMAPALAESFHRGRLTSVPASPTVADGLAVGRPGRKTFPIVQRYVDTVVTVGEEEIAYAITILLERTKLLVEGAGAVGVAAILGERLFFPGKRVVVLLTGGNVDINLLSRTLDHGLAQTGRFVAIRVVVLDRPGQLRRVLNVLANEQVNVLEVTHHRRGVHLPMGQVQVEVLVETRDTNHALGVAKAMERAGYLQAVPVEPMLPPSILNFTAKDITTLPP